MVRSLADRTFQLRCAEDGGSLAVIEDAQQNEFIRAWKAAARPPWVLIGLTSQHMNRDSCWYWDLGASQTRRNKVPLNKLNYVNWVLNVSAKCLHFRFEFAEGQTTKIQAKHQNSFQAPNAKISAVSTPILTGKAAFFKAFFALFQTH